MLRFLKSFSRAVHEEQQQEQDEYDIGGGGGGLGGSGDGSTTSLTVWRKSLFVGCSGFTVIDGEGNLEYRVDNYGSRRPQEMVLMDGSGRPILTVSHTKKLGLVDNWLVYGGEAGDNSVTRKNQKLICCARKQVSIFQPSANRLAHVYRPTDRSQGYVIEGSYAQRSCKVVNESGKVVAEIRKKEAVMEGISFGLEVFVLVIHPGFSPAFAMATVLLLDQMFS